MRGSGVEEKSDSARWGISIRLSSVKNSCWLVVDGNDKQEIEPEDATVGEDASE